MHPDDLTLNTFVDDGLEDGVRRDVEHHLMDCSQCAELVEELRDLQRAAAALGAVEPPERVWDRIKSASGPVPHITETAGQAITGRRAVWGWLATAAAFVMLTLAGVRFGLPGRSTSGQRDTGRELALSVESELLAAEDHYQNAIAGLETIAKAGEGSIDPETAATLRKSLAVVDQAIVESRAALGRQPGNAQAQQSLLDGLKTKVGLLQDTVGLIILMNDKGSGGDQAPDTGAKKRG